jgi:hypothetical protein
MILGRASEQLIAKVKKIGWNIIVRLHSIFKNKEMIKTVFLFY